MPKFSVIIPLYNKEKYITGCLQSVVRQTFSDFEIIVVDDGSSDNSVDTINKTIHDDRMRVISQKNAGPSAARNTGIKAALGEWIVFLDADDSFLPWALSTFDRLIEEQCGQQYYICNYYLGCRNRYSLFTQKKSDCVVKRPFLWEFLEILSDRPGSAVYKRNLLLRHLFNESLRRFEDAESQYAILNEVNPYQCSIPVMISNRDYSEAAGYRKNINEDFVGHISFENKSFLECLVLYKIAFGAKKGYGTQVETLYHEQFKRLDYKICYFLCKLWNKFYRTVRKKKEYSMEDIFRRGTYVNGI
jgi:glycosyltransferase involved in cell wall biosynthesis